MEQTGFESRLSHEKPSPALLLSLCCLARTSPAPQPNPFFVFDNGLKGTNLKTIDAQLDLVKEIGFDGLSWRTDSPARIKQVLDGAKQRGLKVCAIYANLDLKDGKLVYDPRIKEIIPLCRGTGTMLWPNLTSKQFKNSDPAGDDIAVAGLRELADLCEPTACASPSTRTPTCGSIALRTRCASSRKWTARMSA